jgi:hypothetical protein
MTFLSVRPGVRISPGYLSVTAKVAIILVVKVRIDKVISSGLDRVMSSPRKSFGMINLNLKCLCISCCSLDTATVVDDQR